MPAQRHPKDTALRAGQNAELVTKEVANRGDKSHLNRKNSAHRYEQGVLPHSLSLTDGERGIDTDLRRGVAGATDTVKTAQAGPSLNGRDGGSSERHGEEGINRLADRAVGAVGFVGDGARGQDIGVVESVTHITDALYRVIEVSRDRESLYGADAPAAAGVVREVNEVGCLRPGGARIRHEGIEVGIPAVR